MCGAIFGVFLIATGVILVSISSGSLNAAEMRRVALLQDAFVWSPSSPKYTRFEQSDTFGYAMDEPIYTSFYLWNLTNAAGVLAGTEQPVVSQIGPYTYEKTSRKVDVMFLPSKTTSKDYGNVRYRVVSSYAFVASRSNGSESDSVVTVNATYARVLAKYRQFGYSERLLVANLAHQHMTKYDTHLKSEFIANTKQRALQFFLPHAIHKVRQESLGPAIDRQRQRVDSASLPRNLVQMMAAARTEAIPQVLGDVMKDVSDKFIPEILQSHFDAAKDHALPRVLSNLQARLKVEAVPVLLQRQLQTQQVRHVPITLNSLFPKLPYLAFPYVIQEVFERACLEAVPSMLHTIKHEIIARDIVTNTIQADVAQNNVIEAWRKRTTSPRVDFDAWIDDTPTGQSRTGFELRPPNATVELSKEVATLLLGSKSSNQRFSLVDYDVQATAAYPLDQPTDTPVGFAIWKQVIAMNETAIAYVIESVNNDVALASDFITRAQVLFIRAYLLQWARGDVVRSDRERFWRQNYVKRTADSALNEPQVDLDIEKPGIQTGFNLQLSGASTSVVTPAIVRQIWNASDPFSFANVKGFTLWYQATVLGSSSASQELIAGIPGLTTSHMTEISAWLVSLLNDGFVTRRALRHWSDGTCRDVFKLPRTPCLLYDLEPHIAGIQSGFEMNPSSDSTISVAQALREELWDKTQPTSFLYTVHEANITAGYGRWLSAVRVDSGSDVLAALSTSYPTLTSSGVNGIISWLRQWSANDLHVLNIYNWWRTATCWPREALSSTTTTSAVTTGEVSCMKSYDEVEKSAQVTINGAAQSPFSTTERVLDVTQVDCDWDAAASTYTKNVSSYQLTVHETSCDALSTELSDDHAPTEWKSGFEIGPQLTTTEAARRPSLAVVSLLWDPSNLFSFIHPTGYKKWVFDYLVDPSAQKTALMAAINAQITTGCAKAAVGAGVHSSIFNVTLLGTDASCGQVTLDQIETIQTWVSTQATTASWVESALLDQWRRGQFDSTSTTMDIEPYRPGKQAGWELSTGCQCSLTTVAGTNYSVPRAALTLWDPKTNNATFLTTSGYALWVALANATTLNDTAAVPFWKDQIALASNVQAWEPWLDTIASWLTAWTNLEHLVRDVLGHWLHGTCTTSPPVLSVVSEPSPIATTETSCPVVLDRYTVSFNDTLDDLLAAASRPQFAQFFDADVVDKTAFIRPTKAVEATETWIDCAFVTANQYTQTKTTRVTVKNYPSCNFLGVLADGTTTSIPIVQQEATFEMNRTVDDQSNFVSMEVAFAAWVDGDSSSSSSSSTSWAFTNVTTFLATWQPAVHRSEARSQLETELSTAIVSASNKASTLTAITDYLEMWESSSSSTRRVGQAWLVSTKPYLDLDAVTDGIQGGFELISSSTWRQIVGTPAVSFLPDLDQAEYLWNPRNEYSFLNREIPTPSNRFPMGFRAWKEIYDGIDYSSERLVTKYPEVDAVERDPATSHGLNESDRALLLELMVNTTTLTVNQTRGIASWLMAWSENGVLRDYLYQLWATARTPRGDEDVTIDLAPYLATTFGLVDVPATSSELTLAKKDTALFDGAVAKSTLRKLWDVKTTGSLVNPSSRDVWCWIDHPKYGVCPHVLDELGGRNDSSYKSFLAIVQPVVADQEIISRSSNLTKLALLYYEMQFGLKSNQVLLIATWWRSVPDTSSFFQALQVDRWRSTDNPLADVDPLWFGFGLAQVFPSGDPVIRLATPSNLVANPTDLSPTSCNISMNLVTALWNKSSGASFLNGIDGSQKWISYAEQDASPRKTSTMLADLSVVDDAVASAATRADSASISCTLDAVANWVLSFEHHPLTRQLVESLWFQPPAAKTSPLSFFQEATALVKAFPVAGSDPPSSSASAQEGSPLLQVQAWIAQIVFDSNESIALTNLTHGFPIWKTLFVNCSSTKPAALTCAPSSDKEIRQMQTTRADAALDTLVSGIYTRIQAMNPTSTEEKQSIKHVIEMQLVPWLLYWLDHPVMFEYFLQHVVQVDPSLEGISGLISYGDLPAIQFANGTITQVNYTLPASDQAHLDKKTYDEHIGFGSERVTRPILVFASDSSQEVVVVQNVSGSDGFAEFKAFCTWNGYDRVFAYDESTTCTLMTSPYTVEITTAQTLLSTFSDSIEWTILASTDDSTTRLPIPRAALLIDAFLAQPFKSAEDCHFLMKEIVAAYSLTGQQKQRACSTTTAQGILLDLPQLEEIGFSASLASLDRFKDFQAYLRYTATKFIYEPSILGLARRPLVASDLADGVQALDSWTTYPVGGYIALQNVSQLLLSTINVSHNPAGQETTTMAGTYLAPLRGDVDLLSDHTAHTLGELVAINESTSFAVLGTSFPLSSAHATDGSQFTTAVLAARRIQARFPPPTLLFYWDFAKRLVQLSYSKNVTRFGIPLMRYTIENWQEPTLLPSGLDVQALADASVPTSSVNVSTLVDGFPLVLSSPPVTAIGPHEQARESAVDIDPVTGMVYHRRLSWQLTTRVASPDAKRDVWHRMIAKCWLPVMWVREQRSVSPSEAQGFVEKMVSSGPFAADKLARWGLVAGAVYMIIGAVVSYVYLKRARMMRIRKTQSVMPAGAVATNASGESSASSKPLSGTNTKSVSHHVDETSDIATPLAVDMAGGSGSISRSRRRTIPRIPTIVEAAEDGLDVQHA